MKREAHNPDFLANEIHNYLYTAPELEGHLGSIPYLCPEELPPGERQNGANWTISVYEVTPKMTVALTRALSAVQLQFDMQTHPPGSSFIG